jgi:hypothetical protein
MAKLDPVDSSIAHRTNKTTIKELQGHPKEYQLAILGCRDYSKVGMMQDVRVQAFKGNWTDVVSDSMREDTKWLEAHQQGLEGIEVGNISFNRSG